MKASTYRLLAEALAARGIASVRIDKRGLFGSAGTIADPNKVTIADYATDARVWVKTLKMRTGACCVWLLGHSEGALVALTAARDPADLCGLILVGGAGRRLGDLLRQQLRDYAIDKSILDEGLQAIDRLELGKHVDDSDLCPPLKFLFRSEVQDYLIDELSYDPVSLVKNYSGPVLVVQGTTDLQTSMEDASRLVNARNGITLGELKGVNHVLKSAPADRFLNLATYADRNLKLAPKVADLIATFIKKH